MPGTGRYALAAMLMLCSLACRAAAQALVFDMPAQPLAVALSQFHRLSGQSLLYDDELVKGRSAPAVRGLYLPDEALQRLLAGSGLVARYTSQAAFVLVPEPAAAPVVPEAAPDVPAPASPGRQPYHAAVQAAVIAVLCGDPRTVPGPYRLALNLWIDETGRVERVQLHPTGDAARDARIQSRLSAAVLPSLPPGVAQPLTLLVLPRQPARTGDCARPAREAPPT